MALLPKGQTMANQDDIEETETVDRGGDIRSLRKAAEEGAAARNEANELRRQLMFAKAGIDWESDKLGKLLYKTWEGGDLDALRSEAAELGIGRTAPTMSADVEAQADFRRNLSSGPPAAAYEPPSMDPRDAAMQQFHEDRKRGVPREMAALAAFDRIFSAAAEGDERVIFNPDTWAREAYR